MLLTMQEGVGSLEVTQESGWEAGAHRPTPTAAHSLVSLDAIHLAALHPGRMVHGGFQISRQIPRKAKTNYQQSQQGCDRASGLRELPSFHQKRVTRQLIDLHH